MAKKKQTTNPPEKPKVQRTTTATSLRLTPRCHASIDRVASAFEMSKAAVVEAGVHLLEETLSRSNPKAAVSSIESAKNPK